MSRVFYAGEELTEDGLKIIIKDNYQVLFDPFYIKYYIVDHTTGSPIIVDNILEREPIRVSVGVWYAPYKVKPNAPVGEYYIHWVLQDTAQTERKEFKNCFNIVKDSTISKKKYSDNVEKMLMMLRIKLADNDPDKNYRFAPPASVNEVNTYTTNHGFIWLDYELLSFLEQGVDEVNYMARGTGFSIESLPPTLRPLVTDIAAIMAIEHLQLRWIQDEFNYSLNGISLDLTKSDKYASLAQTLRAKVSEALTNLQNNRSHVTKGLRQSSVSFGYGHRSRYVDYGSGAGSFRKVRGF